MNTEGAMLDHEKLFASGSVEFVGNATALIRYGGMTVLAVLEEIDRLPSVDVVVLSQLHGDAFDQFAESPLDHEVPIVTTPDAARALRNKGFAAACGLRTGQRLVVSKLDARLTVTSVPAERGPGLMQLIRPSVMGSLLEWNPAGEGAPALRMYISGDTLQRGQLREIPRRFPGIDLALLHTGGTSPSGVLLAMDALQGVEAVRFDDHPGFKSRLGDFAREVEAAGFAGRVACLRPGQKQAFTVGSAAARAVGRERFTVSAADLSSQAAGVEPPAALPGA
jgi:L-ascorbate metabolism protein UlaG (beta-lactamase superfamily)